jgi:hypothetical protein
MSIRGKANCVRLLKGLRSANSAPQVRRRLKGGLVERSAVIARVGELLSIIRTAGDGREYAGNSDLNIFVGEQRTQAADQRLTARQRLLCCERLLVIENFLPDTELDDSVTSTYLKSLLTPTQPEAEVKPVAIDYAERIRIALAAAQTGGSNGLLQMEHQPS